MTSTKTMLAASAAVSLLGVAAAAQATTVGSSAATLSSNVHLSTTLIETGSGSGSGTLDSVTGFTFTGTEVAVLGGGVIVPSQTVTINETDVFTGTISGTTFTATGGKTTDNSCTGGSDCPTAGSVNSFTSVSGTVSLVKGGTGTLTGLSKPQGTKSQDNWTVTSFTPAATGTVPLPPAVWLLGSGLLGLVGTARRRRKGSAV